MESVRARAVVEGLASPAAVGMRPAGSEIWRKLRFAVRVDVKKNAVFDIKELCRFYQQLAKSHKWFVKNIRKNTMIETQTDALIAGQTKRRIFRDSDRRTDIG